MTPRLAHPLFIHFRADSGETIPAKGFFGRLFQRGGWKLPHRESRRASFEQRGNPHPDALMMLDREINRIRLQSRHWLM